MLVAGWLPADDDPDRPQAVLATVGPDGYPNARTVLVSAVDRTGFAFHTHRASRKVAELAVSPRAALVLTWPGFTRQLVVRGDVVGDTAESAARVWAARSEHLRRLAWLNDDALAALDLAGRRAGWAADVTLDAGPAPSWVGFRVVPHELTFWAGGAGTASRRLQYLRTGAGWSRRWLAG